MNLVRSLAIAAVLLFSQVAAAGSIALVESTMTLVPPIDADLLSVFDAEYAQAQVSLSTPGFADSWAMTNLNAGMTSVVHVFESDDSLAQLAVVMDSNIELTDETWSNVERFDFRYAHPALNDVENPTTWLTMSAKPIDVPESSGLVLLALGVFMTLITILR